MGQEPGTDEKRGEEGECEERVSEDVQGRVRLERGSALLGRNEGRNELTISVTPWLGCSHLNLHQLSATNPTTIATAYQVRHLLLAPLNSPAPIPPTTR